MGKLTWLGIVATVASLCAYAPDAKATGEFRLKLDVDDILLQSGDSALNLRPMMRTEQRFRDQGLVLLKVFAGLRSDVTSWLTLQAYYAHKDMFYSDRKEVHMAVADAIFHFKAGPVHFSDKNGNEWHSDANFYRYRNELQVNFNPGLSWLRLWVGDEVRFDSDQARFNMNDALAGVDFRFGRLIRWRLYYDLESKHRSKPNWENTHVFQMMLIVRLGPWSESTLN